MSTSEHPVQPILSLEGVEAAYDDIIVALRGVSLTVPQGAIVALLGANGAGKSTTLKAASGMLAAERGVVTRGRITFAGASPDGVPPRELVRKGLVQVLEGRHCFPHLTVEENLVTGALIRKPSRRVLRAHLDRIYSYFPRLTQVRRTRAGYVSGGEQQMIAIGRALMANPTLVLLDEPSMGLAPRIVEEIFGILRVLNQSEGISFLLAEQNARVALRFADWGYVLENGRVVADGASDELRQRPDIQEIYLGTGGTTGASTGPARVRHPAFVAPT